MLIQNRRTAQCSLLAFVATHTQANANTSCAHLISQRAQTADQLFPSREDVRSLRDRKLLPGHTHDDSIKTNPRCQHRDQKGKLCCDERAGPRKYVARRGTVLEEKPMVYNTRLCWKHTPQNRLQELAANKPSLSSKLKARSLSNAEKAIGDQLRMRREFWGQQSGYIYIIAVEKSTTLEPALARRLLKIGKTLSNDSKRTDEIFGYVREYYKAYHVYTIKCDDINVLDAAIKALLGPYSECLDFVKSGSTEFYRDITCDEALDCILELVNSIARRKQEIVAFETPRKLRARAKSQ